MAGIVIAGVSAVTLAVLARTKRNVASRLSSPALHADSWVSAVGAALAAITLVGTALARAFSWTWLDPVAAVIVAVGAIVLSVMLHRDAPTPTG